MLLAACNGHATQGLCFGQCSWPWSTLPGESELPVAKAKDSPVGTDAPQSQTHRCAHPQEATTLIERHLNLKGQSSLCQHQLGLCSVPHKEEPHTGLKCPARSTESQQPMSPERLQGHWFPTRHSRASTGRRVGDSQSQVPCPSPWLGSRPRVRGRTQACPSAPMLTLTRAQPLILISVPALTLEGRWMVHVAQIEDSPMDMNLDTAAALGSPMATHHPPPSPRGSPSYSHFLRSSRAREMSPALSLSQSKVHRGKSLLEAGPWWTATAGRGPALPLPYFHSAASSPNKPCFIMSAPRGAANISLCPFG